jgi:HK97 family phage portal protein
VTRRTTANDLLAQDAQRTARALSSEKRGIPIRQQSEATLENIIGRTITGATVNEQSATSVACVMACVRLLSDMVAKLPIKLYRKGLDNSRLEVTDHVAAKLLLSPNGFQTRFQLFQIIQAGVGFGGNGYARIHRDAYNQPTELEWLKPIDVTPQYVKEKRTVVYSVAGESNLLRKDEVLHVRSLSINGVTGISPLRACRESIGLQLTQRDRVGYLARNGTQFDGYLVSAAATTKQQMEDAKKEWKEKQSGPKNAGNTPILWGGWDYKAVNGMTMEDAQFLDSRKFERSEIAMWYGVPSIMIGDTEKASSWGTGIEQITLGFLNFNLDPWLINWEQALNGSLLTTQEVIDGFYFQFNRRALLSVALEAQANFFRVMRDIGVYSVNDVRRRLEENPIDGGDDYRQNFNGSGGAVAPAPIQAEPKA